MPIILEIVFRWFFFVCVWGGGHQAHLEPELQLLEVDDNGIGRDDDDVAPSSTKFQTALARFLDKLKRYHKKGKSSEYNFQDDGNISLAPAVHV